MTTTLEREIAYKTGFNDVDRHYRASPHLQKLHLFDECPYRDPELAHLWKEGWRARESEISEAGR